MRSSKPNTGRTRRSLAIAALVGLVFALAAAPVAAGGKTIRGSSFLEAKDAGQMILQLEDLRIRVTDDTRIYDADEKRISFAMIPDPNQIQSVVEYSGTAAGRDTVVATRLVVKAPPQ